MAIEVFSPELAYATKGNIKAPAGSNATTMAAAAQQRLNDALSATGVTVTVPSTSIQVANP